MSVLVAPLPTPTTPGVEVTSGALTAVVHDGFPGVLLRVLGATGPVTIWRADGAEQIAVRSAAPLIPAASGEGHAYDAETTPDRTYLYSVTIGGTESTVTVRLPGYGTLGTLDTGWLVCVSDPSRSRLVTVQGSPERVQRHGQVGVSPVFGGLGVARWATPAGGLAWQVTLVCDGKAARDDVLALVESGPVLFHARPDVQALADGYLLPFPAEVAAIGAVDWMHLVSVPVERVARPAPMPGTPLRVPYWGWTESTAGLTSAAAYATAYPTTWDQLLAGVQ